MVRWDGSSPSVLGFVKIFYLVQGILGITFNKRPPCWVPGYECATLSRNFTICDPDKLLNYSTQEMDLLNEEVIQCQNRLRSKEAEYNSLKKNIVYIRDLIPIGKKVGVADKNKDKRSLEELGKCLEQWFNLTSVSSFMIIVRWERFTVYEWLSDGVLETRTFQPNKNNSSSYLSLYGAGREVETSVWLTQMRMCEIMEEIYLPPANHKISSYLWAILIIFMVGGFISFGCWMYKFGKNHPTEEATETDIYELEKVENQESLPGSSFILTKSPLKATSPEPTRLCTESPSI